MRVRDKNFEMLFPHEKIQQRIAQLAGKINQDYKGQSPLFLAVLNGSFLFAADLLKKVELECQISFVKLASYEAMASSGQMKDLIGLNEEVRGRRVIILEDIVDTGNTVNHLLKILQEKGVKDIEIASLLLKPEVYGKKYPIKYVGFEIANKFVVGYGLDYDGLARNLDAIYQLVEE